MTSNITFGIAWAVAFTAAMIAYFCSAKWPKQLRNKIFGNQRRNRPTRFVSFHIWQFNQPKKYYEV